VLIGRILADGQRLGHLDLEATEAAVRAAMLRLGASLLEQLLSTDGGRHLGPHIACGQGHQATFVDYRTKGLQTTLGPVRMRRAYYHCTTCRHGVIPKDRELDVVGTGCSPALRRLLARVGSQQAFARASADLDALADVRVGAKQVERVAEAIGIEAEALHAVERGAALQGKLLPCLPPVPKIYIAIDGTGVPMARRETEGHQGKVPGTQARTREAKLGCVFTQTILDAHNRPQRDPNSTSYVGAIEPAEAFGARIYAEAVRRGHLRAQELAVLGDGAPWIRTLVEEHFPSATQIVDLFHAREHLAKVAKAAFGPLSPDWQPWLTARSAELDASKVELVVAAIAQLPTHLEEAADEIRKAGDYFRTNAERMRYAHFRARGLFVGSGVIEAGCRTVIGQRLKNSGMHWTVRGANAIIALRCLELSGRTEDFWQARAQI
jgi:hypothetical protein